MKLIPELLIWPSTPVTKCLRERTVHFGSQFQRLWFMITWLIASRTLQVNMS